MSRAAALFLRRFSFSVLFFSSLLFTTDKKPVRANDVH